MLAGGLLIERRLRNVSQPPIPADAQSEVAPFYREHYPHSLWFPQGKLRPEAQQLVALLSRAEDDGLAPRHELPGLRVLLADATAKQPAIELALSEALVRYVRDLRTSAVSTQTFFVDEDLAPRTNAADILGALVQRTAPEMDLQTLTRLNPYYSALRRQLVQDRPWREVDRKRDEVLLANMDRLRTLPPDLGRRYVLIDVASARLWMIENGRPAGSMRVVVGKPDQQTPLLAARIRFVTFNPYWNLPPDLAAKRAVRVLKEGTKIIAKEQLQILSGWEAEPRILEPEEVDWAAVASGEKELRMRQLPGKQNMMGAMKFMLPNRLGVYLHDTPHKENFTRTDRRLSSGCVRVEDAAQLARWLFGGALPKPDGTAEQRIDLPEPTPVYIVYMTVRPSRSGLIRLADIYGRDQQLGPIRSSSTRREQVPGYRQASEVVGYSNISQGWYSRHSQWQR